MSFVLLAAHNGQSILGVNIIIETLVAGHLCKIRNAYRFLWPIGVNRPAIVREIPHFGQNVPHFWLYFEITKITENRNNCSCTETFCSKKLRENVSDIVT